MRRLLTNPLVWCAAFVVLGGGCLTAEITRPTLFRWWVEAEEQGETEAANERDRVLRAKHGMPVLPLSPHD